MSSVTPSRALPFPIKIAVQDPSWDDAGFDYRKMAETAISAVWPLLDAGRSGELSLALVGDDEIRILNRDYRGKDKPTNVLSFPMSDPAFDVLGDIVLAFQTLHREALEKSISLVDHFTHLAIHGFLHLQGYDHDNTDDALKMEALEITALNALGVDNPYEIHDE